MNTDLVNTVMVGTEINNLVVPIAPNGSLSVDPASNWYVVGLVAGIAPLVVVPNGQNNFLGVTAGLGGLAIPSIHSPNYNPVTGVGWTINQDGTASFTQIDIVIQANGIALLIYFPTPGAGNLIGSWAASQFMDQYGNNVPAGLNANGGQLASIALNAPSVVGGTIFQTLLNAVTITASNITGGTSYEQTITFDSGGGMLFGYSTTVTTVTQTANGTYTQTLPPGVTTINNAFCWASGAGGSGGTTTAGGRGGGGGEFAGEPNYTPTTNPFTYSVGNGGNANSTGNGNGGDGTDSFIDGNGVFANGGNGDGTPGTGSTNTIHFDGGTGGTISGNTGGASGGNSGSPTAKGNNGLASVGSGHAGAPAAQANAGNGGAGADAGTGPASNGTSPGAGGGGAGNGSSGGGTLTKTYEANYTASYYGPDATGSPNALRSTSVMYQGGETAGGGAFNGNQRAVAVFDTGQISSDFAGYTATQLTVKFTNQHSWYNSGMLIDIGAGNNGGYYPLTGGVPSHWLGNTYRIGTLSTPEGVVKSFNLGAAVATQFIAAGSGGTNILAIGADVAGGAPYNLSYYGFFTGGHGTGLTITITGTKVVAGSETSGQGSDGKVSFTFSSSQAMVFALSPQAATDAGGNAFAAGYTGPVNAFHPGTTPAVVETWQTFPVANGWVIQGAGDPGRYKLMPDNTVMVELDLNDSAATSGTMGTLPVGYRPAVTQFILVSIFNPAGVPALATIQITTGGAFNVLLWSKQSRQYVCNFSFSID
jgi:hypothetical protein